MNTTHLSMLSTGLLLVAASIANAAPVDFFGEDINTTRPSFGSDTPKRLPSTPVSDAAYSTFLSALSGWKTDNLESYASSASPGTAIGSVNWTGGVTGTLSGLGKPTNLYVAPGATSTFYGVYPHSGTNTLYDYTKTKPVPTWSMTFNKPQSAFGFWVTDAGDYHADLNLKITYADSSTRDVSVPFSADHWKTSGSVFFWGTVDSDVSKKIAKVEFKNTKPDPDGFGYDDFVIGSVPEPTVLALGGLAAAAAFWRRRRMSA